MPTLVVGTEKGAFVLRSSDRKTWKVSDPLFKGWKATCAARSPSGKWILGTASRVYGAALQESRDLRTFTQIEKGPAYPEGGNAKLNQIWTLLAGDDRHYAGVEEGGLFRSDDDGATWRPVAGLNGHPTRDAWFPGAGGLCCHSIVRQGKRLWVGISAVGVFRSDDDGETWRPKNAGIRQVIEDKAHKDIGFCVHGLAADPAAPGRLYRQDHTGMYVTDDGGDSWKPAMEGMPSWFGFPVATDPNTGHVFAFPMESDEYRMPVGGRFRVYRSRDRGATWEERAEGLPAQPTWAGVLRGALAVDGLDPAGVYVGSTSGEIHASADDGDTWRRLPVTLPRILSVDAFPE